MESSSTRKCPFCGETINRDAKKCMHCLEWISEEARREQEEKIKQQEQESFQRWREERRTRQKKEDAEVNGCLFLFLCILIIGIGSLFHFTIPSEHRMQKAIREDVYTCLKGKTESLSNQLFGESLTGVASQLFDTNAQEKVVQEIFAANNQVIIEQGWFWSTGYIRNHLTGTEGVNVCLGILGIVIPYVSWDDFVLLPPQ